VARTPKKTDEPFGERSYRRRVEEEFGFLPAITQGMVNTGASIPLDWVWVAPQVSTSHVLVDSEPEKWPEFSGILSAIKENPTLVVLGDPGSGKSMLIRWLAKSLASPAPNEVQAALGNLIPIPVILRDMDLSGFEDMEASPADLVNRLFISICGQGFLDGQLQLVHIRAILKEGRACFLVDGFDEVVDMRIRRGVRDALASLWPDGKHHLIVTSRIVGYDAMPMCSATRIAWGDSHDSHLVLPGRTKHLCKYFSEQMLARHEDFVELRTQETLRPTRYLAPLTPPLIDLFVSKWWAAREPNAQRSREESASFLAGIQTREDLKQLARSPQILGMMCLVQRVDNSLPEGRARLFERVVSSYLQTIPDLRKLPLPFPRGVAERVLARIAFEMQKARSKAKEGQPGILAGFSAVGRWITAELKRIGADLIEPEAFLQSMGTASGLFLEMGLSGKVRQYGFLHLSFQEYLAARHIQETKAWTDQVSLFGTPAIERTHDLEQLILWFRIDGWRETFRLLFQIVDEDSSVRLLSALYENFTKSPARDIGVPLSNVACDPFSSLPRPVRLNLAQSMLGVNPEQYGDYSRWHDHRGVCDVESLLILLSKHGVPLDKDVATRWSALSVDVSSLEPLRMLTKLRFLNITGSSCQDFEVLSAFEDLIELHAQQTTFSDTRILAPLDKLTTLGLSSSGVQMIEPLKELPHLRELQLHGCPIKDIGVLSQLKSLRDLGLTADGSSLDFLEGLKLTELRLSGTASGTQTISNMVTLKSLSVRNLDVKGKISVDQLTKLKSLHIRLEQLNLNDLPHLTSLYMLYLRGPVEQEQLDEIHALVPHVKLHVL